MKSAKQAAGSKAVRLERENAQLQEEAVGMRRQLGEQADRIDQLERETTALQRDRDHADRLASGYERAIGHAAAKLEKAMEPGADTAAYVREVVAHLKGLVTL